MAFDPSWTIPMWCASNFSSLPLAATKMELLSFGLPADAVRLFFSTRRSRGRLVQAKTRRVGSPHPPKRSEKEEFQLNQKHPKVTGESKRWDFHSDKQISITAYHSHVVVFGLGMTWLSQGPPAPSHWNGSSLPLSHSWAPSLKETGEHPMASRASQFWEPIEKGPDQQISTGWSQMTKQWPMGLIFLEVESTKKKTSNVAIASTWGRL